MDHRLDSMENRLDSMDHRLESVEKKIDFLHDDVVRVKENQEFQEQQIDTFIQKTAKNSSDIRTLKRVLNNN
jgi:cupin superfamily acireductone dioxygenase involved in methionine salvage